MRSFQKGARTCFPSLSPAHSPTHIRYSLSSPGHSSRQSLPDMRSETNGTTNTSRLGSRLSASLFATPAGVGPDRTRPSVRLTSHVKYVPTIIVRLAVYPYRTAINGYDKLRRGCVCVCVCVNACAVFGCCCYRSCCGGGCNRVRYAPTVYARPTRNVV